MKESSSSNTAKTSWKERLSKRLQCYLQRHQFPGLHIWNRDHRDDLAEYRDAHRGEDCFIIGNGPSLNRMELSRLNDFALFGLNKIHLLMDRAPLDLTYHVCVNPLVMEQSMGEFSRLGCPSFLPFQKANPQQRRQPGTRWLYTDGAPLHFATDVLRPINEGWTVTFVALQLAYFMGFDTVYLVGVDHSFAAKGRPNETQVMEGDDESHFDPNYFKGLSWQLPDLEGSELAYRMARFFFERDGRRVVDATVDGKLQIFDKMPLEKAYEVARRRGATDRPA